MTVKVTERKGAEYAVICLSHESCLDVAGRHVVTAREAARIARQHDKEAHRGKGDVRVSPITVLAPEVSAVVSTVPIDRRGRIGKILARW